MTNAGTTSERILNEMNNEKIYKKWFESPVPPKQISFNFAMSDQLKQRYANPNDKALE